MTQAECDKRELPEPLVGAIVDAVFAITEHNYAPTFLTKVELGTALENVVYEILAEVDRRIVGYPR